MKKKSPKFVGRRNTLKTVSTGIVGTSLVGITGATDDKVKLKEVVKSSLKYRDDLNNDVKSHRERQQIWADYLNDKGVVCTQEFRSDEIPTVESDDEIGTEDYLKSELDITMSIARSAGDNYYAELSWTYDDSSGSARGINPVDSVGMSYERDWWDWGYGTVSETTQTSTYVDTNTNDGYDGEGPAYFMDDRQASDDGNAGFTHYAGMYLEPAGPDENDRRVYGAYIHNYSGISTNYNVSVGLSVGVITISSGYSGGNWKTRFEDDENTPLRVHEDDVIS